MAELTTEQQNYQLQQQALITVPISILGLIAGLYYASKKGKSKWVWGLMGLIVPATATTVVLRLIDYGNPVKS